MLRLIDRLSDIAAMIAAALLAVAIVVVCQMVFIRYVLVGSTAWQTDVVTYSLVAAVLLGSGWVLKERGHVAVGIVTEHASPAARRLMQSAADAVVLFFSAIMLFKAVELWWQAFDGGWTTNSVVEFALWIPYLALPIGFGLLSLQALACLIRTLRGEDTFAGPRTH